MTHATHAPALPDVILEPIVRLALLEDLAPAGDLTSDSAIEPDAKMSAEFRAREPGVIAGVDAARLALRLLDPEALLTVERGDGANVAAGDRIATVTGLARSILMAERTMLNFMGHLSGIATLTRRYVEAVAGTSARITCTRKTTPGLRALEKRAVRLGGAINHRYSLADAILIKDNHIAAAGGVGNALSRAKAQGGHMRVIEIEVDTLQQLAEALPLSPHCILLDNMSLEQLREAVAMTAGRAILEASGNVRLETVRDIAATGVDVISVGALTHSARRLDLGLDVT
ncbi:MAG: carboxylating nicotinate-nucleotide diphosphorylase [Sinobacteraceae bacterium]|nr:carboxylating nicotinate-nucleotide diphosphorylase [Nevskiaceae bacterium]